MDHFFTFLTALFLSFYGDFEETNSLSKVELVQFEGKYIEGWLVKDAVTDSILIETKGRSYGASLISDDSLDTSRITKRMKLDISEYKKYSKLIYTDKKCEIRTALCYSPAHGILFTFQDSSVEFLELCFRCVQYRATSDRVDPKYICFENYKKLEAWFEENDIL